MKKLKSVDKFNNIIKNREDNNVKKCRGYNLANLLK